jgi:3'-5' exonuclease/Ankyrin repeats (3 copies)
MIFDFLFILLTTMNSERAHEAQLRRASGSQSLQFLIDVIETGWTVEDINQMAAQGNGKGALHMAAWQGCMENVKYLLNMGCDIDIISQGEFSYGKTAIFFALTRSRKDVIDYLLDKGAWVKIVNNKGQSVLSIAASHVSEELVRKIQAKEAEQAGPWWNFRATHSDGCEYGDLDPRFLGDRLPQPTDIVTKLVINPTTKASRKGAFQRRNPHIVPDEARSRYSKETQSLKKEFTSSLSDAEYVEIDEAWNNLLDSFSHEQELSCCTDLLTIIRLYDRQRRAWIPEACDKLSRFDTARLHGLFEKTRSSASLREATLLDKMRERVNGSNAEGDQSRRSTLNPKQESPLHPPATLDVEPWREASALVSDLSIFALEQNDIPILSLPQPPDWIDTMEGLQGVLFRLQGCRLVSLDTEWSDNDVDSAASAIATLQISFLENNQVKVFVVDLLPRDHDYVQSAKELIRIMFETDILVLGFAFWHDVQKLQEFTERKFPTDRVLDLQLVLAKAKSSVPGLKSCAARFSMVPLSKEEQCSNWSRRPLSRQQLDYAALDAAILMYLLAEQNRLYNASVRPRVKPNKLLLWLLKYLQLNPKKALVEYVENRNCLNVCSELSYVHLVMAMFVVDRYKRYLQFTLLRGLLLTLSLLFTEIWFEL